MKRIVDILLRAYDKDDPELRLKAKFLLISTFIAILGLTCTLTYTSYTFGIQSTTVFIEAVGFLIMLTALIFLVNGRYEVAGHIILTTGFTVVWSIIATEPMTSKLIKLDTIVFVLVLIAAIPLMFFRNKTPLFVYSIANLAIFCVFLVHLAMDGALTKRELVDYALDNTISLIFIVVFSLTLFQIYHKALNSLKIELSERKRAESSLNEFRTFLTSIINSMPSMVIGIDNGQTIVLWNEETTKVSGVKESEAFGKSLFDVFPQLDFLADEVTAVIQGGHISRIHKQACTWDTTEGVMDITIYPLRYGSKGGAVLRMDDISEQIEMENTVFKSEKMALVGHVAGKISHDFNNVLGIIMGNAELSLMNCNDASTRKTLKLIYDQTIRGKNLTRNLVAFAKDQEPKQEYFSLAEKVDLVLDLLRKDLVGIEVIKDIARDVPELLADPGMIEHTMVNLIQNAVHATSKTPEPIVAIRIHTADRHIIIEVEDNGCGIPEEYLDDIFEPLFTLKGSRDRSGSYTSGIGGTGYGMANVKKYIDRHNGSVAIESTVDHGTKCTIRLPLIEKQLTDEERQLFSDMVFHTNKRILVVEDENAISEVQRSILGGSPCYHHVDIAYDGKCAMEMVRTRPYDLISLDYVLPGKTSGMDVYGFIREQHPNLPILFISGNIEFLESLRSLTKEDAHLAHQSKPCTNMDYLKSVNELLERSGQA